MDSQEEKKGEEKPKVDPPGWNDPPMLQYSSSNPPPKSRITNKRVPFPLNPPCGAEPPQRLPPNPPDDGNPSKK